MPASHHDQLSFRKAEIEEMDWAYLLFKEGLQQYIAQTWGWNELFQRHSFLANLPASSFVIITRNSEDVGGYCLKHKTDHLYLEMLLLTAPAQRQGIGTHVMNLLIDQANHEDLPIRLSVLRNNPAHLFYRRLGFDVVAEDNFRYEMSLQGT
ncbi:N-acetyltransferase [Gammaproteobacteria bacterium LSUCC0112]|nr:N-acetyltransferase [Gammaproteobacteria bacterium LSUCC0112]